MNIVFDNEFATVEGDQKSSVFEVFPNVFGDSRGFFCEVMKDSGKWPDGNVPIWFSNMQWIKQVNRSSSGPGVVRGCHAQKGVYCQAKLVCALTEKIYDVITDARPDSATFGKTKAYVLDPAKQNFLFVPRGFLHAFFVPFSAKGAALFEYWCDNVYDKASETGVNPMSILPEYALTLRYRAGTEGYFDFVNAFVGDSRFALSEKDTAAPQWKVWSAQVKNDYIATGKVWYR